MRRICEVAVFTDRPDEVADFWERVLGRPPDHRGPGIAIFGSEGLTLLIHQRGEQVPGQPPERDHVAVGVADVDGALREIGLRPHEGPADYDWGRSAYLRDPEGRVVELHQT